MSPALEIQIAFLPLYQKFIEAISKFIEVIPKFIDLLKVYAYIYFDTALQPLRATAPRHQRTNKLFLKTKAVIQIRFIKMHALHHKIQEHPSTWGRNDTPQTATFWPFKSFKLENMESKSIGHPITSYTPL